MTQPVVVLACFKPQRSWSLSLRCDCATSSCFMQDWDLFVFRPRLKDGKVLIVGLVQVPGTVLYAVGSNDLLYARKFWLRILE